MSQRPHHPGTPCRENSAQPVCLMVQNFTWTQLRGAFKQSPFQHSWHPHTPLKRRSGAPRARGLFCCCCSVAHLCLTLCDPGNAAFASTGFPPGENTGAGCSTGSSRPTGQTWVSALAGGSFTAEPPGKPPWTLLKRVEFILRTRMG